MHYVLLKLKDKSMINPPTLINVILADVILETVYLVKYLYVYVFVNSL